MIIFLLKHNHYLPNEFKDTKILGVFSSIITCNSAKDEYKTKQGFCEQPSNFEIVKCTITDKKDQVSIDKVFIVQHQYEDNEKFEYVTLIGMFASLKEARNKVVELRRTPPYNRNPLGFSVDDYPLDKMYWIEGYDTWDTANLVSE